MPFVAILGDLSAEFGWAPDAWRRLTWREFQEWVAELGRRRARELEAHQASKERGELESARDAFFRSQGVRV